MPLHWTWQCTAHRQSEVEGCWTDTQHGEVHIQSEFAQISWSRDLKRWNLAWCSPYWSDYRPSNSTWLTFPLCSFLILLSWCSKFLPNFATEKKPLRALVRKATETLLEWTAEADKCFNSQETPLEESPNLALYYPSFPTIVSTDAPDYGLGGVLTQLHVDGVECTVTFTLRTLTTAERKYST